MTTHAKVADSDFTLYVGDVREQLRNLPAESVHCVVTSPPYWGLRDYGTGVWDGGDPDCDHTGPPKASDKSGLKNDGRPIERVGQNDYERAATIPFRIACGKCGARRVDQQLGLEPTPDLYVQNMVDVFREVRRVLRRDGTCWLNIGDSYASQGGPQVEQTKQHIGSGYHGANRNLPGLKPKDLVGIPWRLAFALQADGWYLRSDVIWSKPNPMPESVTDRPTKAHEYLFLLTRSPRYFYDADAIREPHADSNVSRRVALERNGQVKGEPVSRPENDPHHAQTNHRGLPGVGTTFGMFNPAGRNRRSVWEIATEPYPDAHFATFPQALVEPCVLAGTSERGCCPECGAPWEREIEKHFHSDPTYKQTNEDPLLAGRNRNVTRMGDGVTVETTGWREPCNCRGAWGTTYPVSCTVLDPFMGSGTTALVARRLGRKSIGIELNEEYARLCAHRLRQLSLFA